MQRIQQILARPSTRWRSSRPQPVRGPDWPRFDGARTTDLSKQESKREASDGKTAGCAIDRKAFPRCEGDRATLEKFVSLISAERRCGGRRRLRLRFR